MASCVDVHRQSDPDVGRCTSDSRALFLYNGARYCLNHLPVRGWRQSCTHSLGYGPDGRCSYCGAPEPDQPVLGQESLL